MAPKRKTIRFPKLSAIGEHFRVAQSVRSAIGYLSDLDQELCNEYVLRELIVVHKLPGSGGRRRQWITPDFAYDVDRDAMFVRCT